MASCCRAGALVVLEGWKIAEPERLRRAAREGGDVAVQVRLVVVAARGGDLGDGGRRGAGRWWRLEQAARPLEADDARGQLRRQAVLGGEAARQMLPRPADRARQLR